MAKSKLYLGTSESGQWEYILTSHIYDKRYDVCPKHTRKALSHIVWAVPSDKSEARGCKECVFGGINYWKRTVKSRPANYILTEDGSRVLEGFVPLKEEYINLCGEIKQSRIDIEM